MTAYGVRTERRLATMEFPLKILNHKVYPGV